ncbi:MAG: hypothetical protein OXN17_20190 [Candidatus Poribacteria bacterium]|nr:hypothetical protein [Candidatus Poribacteria bacterium]MDE0503601.1 hypothetical protein [Candidatus Poribacteria bacterium]
MKTSERPSSAKTQSRTPGPPVSQQQIIQALLSILQRRMRVQSLYSQLARTAFWGLLLTSGIVLLSRFVRLPNIPSMVLLMPIIVAAVLVTVLSFVRKVSSSAVAVFVDKQMNLKERFSTAVELIQRDSTDELSHLQIRDAASSCTATSPSAIVPYRLPSIFKWLPIPLLLLTASFAMPRMYQLPLPPTASEKKAIEKTVENFNRLIGETDDPLLAKKLQDAMNGLKDTDSLSVQERLSKLRDEVRARKQEFNENEIDEVGEVFAEVSGESNRFKNIDLSKLSDELEKLANEEILDPELQEELRALFRKIAERLEGNRAAKNLTEEFVGLETRTVSPDFLKKIARRLEDVAKLARNREQLEQMLEQIAASRKSIALASLDLHIGRDSGGTANSQGGAGNETATGETQGTIAAADSDFVPDKTVEEAEFRNNPMTTEPTHDLRTDGPELRLKDVSPNADAIGDTDVYVGSDAPNVEEEAGYIPYREVFLNAKQDYAEAIGKNRIPLRYQQLINNYLESIRNP